MLIVFVGCAEDADVDPLRAPVEEVLTVGVLGGDTTEEFGHILDVQAVRDGSFFVLDVQAPSVEWFGPDGEHRDGLHSRGAGPGEVSSANAMDISSNGTLAVVDPANGRISHFGFGPEGLDFDHATSGEWSPFSSGRILCSVAGRTYIRDVHGGRLVHEVDGDSGIVHSFEAVAEASAEEFGRFTDLVTRERNSGHLLCLDDPRMVVSMSSHRPFVRAFTARGELLWEYEAAGFRPWRWVPTENTPTYEVDSDGGSHMGQSIVRWDEQHLLIQYSVSPELGTPDDGDFFALESRLLSLADGREIARTEELPLIADAVGDTLYSFENLPYPRIRLLRRIH